MCSCWWRERVGRGAVTVGLDVAHTHSCAGDQDLELSDLSVISPPDLTRLVHLDVEDFPEELLRQQSYAMKNQLGHPKPPTRGFGTQNTPIGGYLACSSLVLYAIRAPIKGPAWSAFQNVFSGCHKET